MGVEGAGQVDALSRVMHESKVSDAVKNVQENRDDAHTRVLKALEEDRDARKQGGAYELSELMFG